MLINNQWREIETLSARQYQVPEDVVVIPAVYFDNETWEAGVEEGEDHPVDFTLISVYPNPFNSSLRIQLEILTPSTASFSIFNLSGRRVYSRAPGILQPGSHLFEWDADTYASGTYFLYLTTDSRTLTKTLYLLR